MNSNAVVLINFKSDVNSQNQPYVDRCIYAWNYWCNQHNVDFIEIQNPVMSMNVMPATFQRWYIFDYLRNNGLKYEQVAQVDFDTIPSPFCRNFFELTNGEWSAVEDNGDGPCLNRGIQMVKENWMPEVDVNWGNYFNAGFIVFSEKHEQVFKDTIEFYNKEKEKWLKCNCSADFTDDQPVLNFMVRKNGFKVTLLPRSFNVLAWHAWNFLRQDYLDSLGRLMDRKKGIQTSVDIFHLCGDVPFRNDVSMLMLETFKKEYGLS